MSYNTKNYSKQGGDELFVGGALTFGEGATLEGLPLATKDNAGGVLAQKTPANVEASDVETLVNYINNTLIPALKKASVFLD